MIGQYIRSFHHFMRVMGTLGKQAVLINYRGRLSDGIAFYTKRGIVIFCQNGNHNYEDLRDYLVEEPSVYSDIKSTLTNYDYCTFTFVGNPYDFHCFSEIVILPIDFTERYEKLLSSNKKLFRSVIGVVCNEKDPMLKYFFHLFGEKANIMLWATSNYFKQGVPISFFKHIAYWQDNYGQLANKLSKGTVTAYNNLQNITSMDNECAELKRGKRINDVINSFNTQQKKALKSLELTPNQKEALSKFYTLSSTKKLNFIRKVSTIEDPHEVLSQMETLCNVQFEWNKDSLLNYIANSSKINCEIIFNEGNVIFLKVNDYDTVKYLAKSTNWCISKNKSYWNNYVERQHNATQYMIFDFNLAEDDEYSIVGFTTNANGKITNAHSFTNKNMKEGRMSLPQLHCFGNTSIKHINTLINELKIPFKQKSKQHSQFEWNMKSFYKAVELFETQSRDFDYVEYLNRDNVIVASIDGDYAHYLLDIKLDELYEHIDLPNVYRYIVFLDFNKDLTDDNHLQYAIIGKDERKSIEYCRAFFNNSMHQCETTFNGRLLELGLPYDIISRPNDALSRFENAVSSYDIETIDNILSDNPNFLKENKKQIDQFAYSILSIINNALFSYQTLDLLNLFIKMDFKFDSNSDTRCLLSDMIIRTFSSAVNHRYFILDISDESRKRFENNDFSMPNAISLGFLIAFEKLVASTNNEDVISTVCRKAKNVRFNKETFEYFLNKLFQQVKPNSINDRGLLDLSYYAEHSNMTEIFLKAIHYPTLDEHKKSVVGSVINVKKYKTAMSVELV